MLDSETAEQRCVAGDKAVLRSRPNCWLLITEDSNMQTDSTRVAAIGRITILITDLATAILPRGKKPTISLELRAARNVLQALEAFLEPARREGSELAESLSQQMRSMAAAIEKHGRRPAATSARKSARK
jgi:uncharacterized protein YicC (UPF0701 family)